MSKKFEEVKEEVLSKGGLYAILYFQVTGDKEKAKAALVERMSKVTSFPGVKLGVANLEEDDEGFIAEVKLLLKEPRPLFKIVALFSPISVEVVEPDGIHLDAGALTNILMDLADISYTLAIISLSTIAKNKEVVETYKKKLKQRLERAKRLIKHGENRDS